MKAFVGYEVRGNGVTLEWTENYAQAEKVYAGVRGSADLVVHMGAKGYQVTKSKFSTFKLRDCIRNWSM